MHMTTIYYVNFNIFQAPNLLFIKSYLNKLII